MGAILRAHLALACAAGLFGGLNVVLEVGLQPPSDDHSIFNKIGRATCFALYRDVGAALLLGGASALSRGKHWQASGARFMWSDCSTACAVFACGFFGIFAQLGFIVGLALTSANLASLFQPMAPVLTVALSVLMRTERLTAAKALAICLGLGGACVMVDFGHASDASLVGTLCFAVS